MSIIKVTGCVFTKAGLIVGPTVLKFGMEDNVYPGEDIGNIVLVPKSGSKGPCSPKSAFLTKIL